MLRIIALTVLSTLIQASAQERPPSPASPICAGDIVTVRRIEMKAPATLEQYLQTMDIHRAWYRRHGFTNNEIFAARIVLTDPSTGKATYSTTELIAYHVRPPYGPNTTTVHDADWIAFHKTYDAISRIKDQYQICMPKEHGG
jgi:hypothetical protein